MKNKVHFIGIAGSATAPLAILMKEKGWEVSGSDEAVYEPALTLLNKAGITWYEGYKAENVEDADLIILGGAPLMKDSKNVEYERAKELGKKIQGYAYLVGEYLVKEKSIVVAGSYGKTTTTGIVSWILECADKNPSFMIGGKPSNFEKGVRETKSEYSCCEGDEFVSIYSVDHEPRFVYYKPKYTIISASKWDHINVYPEEKGYVDAYKKLIDKTKGNNGKLYISFTGENNNQLIDYAKGLNLEVTSYAVSEDLNCGADYLAKDIVSNNYSTDFKVFDKSGNFLGDFTSNVIGKHNIENFLASIVLLLDLSIPIEIIKKGVETFKGISRRLEIVGTNTKSAIIIDDFAHSAMKAQGSLDGLRSAFPNKKIVAVYNPRISAREDRRELDFYKGAFDKADFVIIPRIIVKKSTPKENRIYGADIINAINQTNSRVEYLPKEENLILKLTELSDENTIIVFMSASGWKGLMEKALEI